MAKAYTNCTSVRNGDRVSGDARPGPVVSYQLTAKEIVARYGPPASPTAKKPFALDPGLWAHKKGGDKDMAVKMTQQEATKTCSQCGETKPLGQFPARGAWGKDRRRAYDAERMRKARAAKAAVDIALDIAPTIVMPKPTVPAATPEPDQINHPAHYTAGKVECIDALEAATEGLQGIEAVCTANVIKYLWRWRHKGGLEDLRKAQWYLQRLISKKEVQQ